MNRIWQASTILTILTAILIFYSLILTWWAWDLGIAFGRETVPFLVEQTEIQIGVSGYFQKLNWLLYPVFWPLLAVFIYFTWEWYMQAWRSLPSNKVLYQDHIAIGDVALLSDFLNQLNSYRKYLIALSLGFGLLLTLIDANCLLHEYAFWEQKICGAPDFTVAFRLLKHFPEFEVDRTSELLIFVIGQYIMQALLITMAFTILFQLLLHTIAFLGFEKFAVSKKSKFSIRLNARDDFHEFGLMSVNKAINLTYVFIAVAMVMPILSVLNKPPVFDNGRLMMAYLLPFLVFLPAFVPIFDRIARHGKVTRYVLEENDLELTKSFNKQKLWPFDNTALSYVGKTCIIAAILSWFYVATGEIKFLFNIFGG